MTKEEASRAIDEIQRALNSDRKRVGVLRHDKLWIVTRMVQGKGLLNYELDCQYFDAGAWVETEVFLLSDLAPEDIFISLQ